MHLPLPGQHTCTFQWRDKHGGSSFAPCAPCEGDIERRQWVETQWGEDVLSVQTSHVTPAVPPPSPAYPEGPVRLPVPGPGMRVSR